MANNREEAVKEIAKLKEEAHAKLTECQKLADTFGIGFSWDLAYGMGGYYVPSRGNKPADADEEEGEWSESEEGGWQSSSQSC